MQIFIAFPTNYLCNGSYINLRELIFTLDIDQEYPVSILSGLQHESVE